MRQEGNDKMDRFEKLNLQGLEEKYANWYRDTDMLADTSMGKKMYPYTKLFSPIQVNSIEVKNRLVMAPMGNINMAEENGRPSERLTAYFEERAKGGVGLLTSGLVPVSQGIDPTVMEAGELTYFPRISGSRTFLSGWRNIAQACHAHGAHFFIQLTAGLGRVGNPECLIRLKKFPRSASFNPNYYLPAVPCLRLSDRKLKKIVRNTGQAAADARAMNIDGVYLHAHEGYLMEQLANRAFNRRKLGRYADWRRFGLDMVEEIRRRTGPDYPIMFRIDLSLMLKVSFGDLMDSDPILKKFRHERSVEETVAYMKDLVRAGVDCFDVDLGCYDNWWLPHPPMFMPPGCFRDVAAHVKEMFRRDEVLSLKKLPVPIVAVGKLGYPDLAEKVLREEEADMIMLGRPLLADPNWPAKAYAGQTENIRPCIGCQEGCINEFVEGGHPICTVNPRCGFETRYPAQAEPAPRRKKVGIVGAGPAGIECALGCLERGHEVYLFDEKEMPGGMLYSAAVHANKADLQNYRTWLQHKVAEAAANPDFHYLPRTLATVNMLEDSQFDTIVCATGSKARMLPLAGAEHAVSGQELTENMALAEGKKKIVIVGAGSVGIELAFILADDPERDIVILEATPWVMKGVCTANRGYLIHYLQKKGNVKIHLCSRLETIGQDHVTARLNLSPTVPDPWNCHTPILPDNIHNPLARPIGEDLREEHIPADLVVMAVGSKKRDDLYKALVSNYCAPEILRVGDAFRPATVKEAVQSGFRAGRSI